MCTKFEINLEHTINSGQVFLWNKSGEEWIGVNGQEIIVVQQDPLKIRSSSGKTDYFFRKDDNLKKILSDIRRDEVANSAVMRFPGLRLVRQNTFQCYISFICSSNASIRNIKLMLTNLCKKFGEKTEFNKHEYFTFPTPEKLAAASTKQLLDCRLGFRAKYVRDAAKMVDSGRLDFEALKKMDYQTSLEKLRTIYGIGNKIADCILLFSLDKLEAFPIDRWSQRILLKYYSKIFNDINEKPLTEKKYEELHKEIVNYFGPYAGYAQQFLFKMERDLNEKNWL